MTLLSGLPVCKVAVYVHVSPLYNLSHCILLCSGDEYLMHLCSTYELHC